MAFQILFILGGANCIRWLFIEMSAAYNRPVNRRRENDHVNR